MPRLHCNATLLTALLASASLLAAIAAPSAAAAKTEQPVRDDNGVNVISRQFEGVVDDLSIGSGGATLSVSRLAAVRDRGSVTRMFPETEYAAYYIAVADGSQWIEFQDRIVVFDAQGNSEEGRLVSGANGVAFHAKDGTIYTFAQFANSTGPLYEAYEGLVTEIRQPDGHATTVHWDIEYANELIGDACCQEWQYTAHSRISSVNNNSGYQLKFKYEQDIGDWNNLTGGQWNAVTQIKALNNTIESIDPASNGVATTNSWPSISYSYPSGGNLTTPFTFTATHSSGAVTSSSVAGSTTTITGPTIGNLAVTVSNAVAGVSAVNNNGVTTTYSAPNGMNGATYRATTPTGRQTTWTANGDRDRVTSVAGPAGTTSFQYDAKKRLTRVTSPETNYVSYSYDARGNLTESRSVAKSGTGLPDIVLTNGYPATCVNVVTCDALEWSKDAAGNQTDYSYDPATGQLLSVTLPAPAANAARPQSRYGYTSRTALYKNGSGVLTTSPVAMNLLTSVSECASGSTCAGTAAERLTLIDYGPSGVATNLLPVATTVRSGDSAVSATTAVTYDVLGSVTTLDGPLPGNADLVRYRYDAQRRLVGEVGPDPDGAGPLKHRAARLGYNAAGLLASTEGGTVNSQSDGDWAAMSVIENVAIDHDAGGRRTKKTLTAGGAVQSVVQHSYDAEGAVECTAIRMNPAAYTALPTSACTLGSQGSHGPDRITRKVYDTAGRLWKVQGAYGTALQDELSHGFTANGQVASVTDTLGNRTSYEYDGHDRLVRTRFPVSTAGANASSATDYEEHSYDAASRLAATRLRDGQSIALSYDALGRVALKDLPGAEPDVSFGYDNLDRLTRASQGSHTSTFGYDALGRLAAETGPHGTFSHLHDSAGARTRTTWPDGFQIDYDYLVTGELWRVRENGATSGVGVLATYGYDDRGRRTTLARGNGTSASYAHDPASRVAQLTEDLAGSAHDQTLGFGYNPAGQIVQNSRSNDIYAWTGHYNLNRNYGANGLNQYTASGTVAPSYDARGNLTQAGGPVYAYSAENMLVSASGGIGLVYDPLLRLYQVGGGSAGTTRFAYDGQDMIAEYDGSGTLLRRYVHGPGDDEPLVWYDGAGTSDRRWLHADERGSVIAVSNGAGTVTAVNRYDEYGIPSSGNIGRFQYTGQMWLPELGMYHYKARIYSPTLGRFLQTDPIGYEDGLNLYAYVGADPVNGRDPTGLNCDGNWLNGNGGCTVTGRRGSTSNPNDRCTAGAYFSGRGCMGIRGPMQNGCDTGFADIQDRECQARPRRSPAPSPRNSGRSLLARGGKCAADHLGLTALGGGLWAAGMPIPGTKQFVTQGSSRGTSVAQMSLRRFRPGAGPYRVPTGDYVGGRLTGKALGWTTVKGTGKAIARWVPFVGQAVLAYDAVSIAVCTWKAD